MLLYKIKFHIMKDERFVSKKQACKYVTDRL